MLQTAQKQLQVLKKPINFGTIDTLLNYPPFLTATSVGKERTGRLSSVKRLTTRQEMKTAKLNVNSKSNVSYANVLT